MWSPSQLALNRAAKRRPTIYPQINMWPFVSVMVVLIFFLGILVPRYHYTHRTPVDLPISAYATPEPRANRDDAIHIAITRWGDVFFNNIKLRSEDLPAFLQASLRAGAEPKVYLSVDARAKYADLAAVVEQIRGARIQEIAVLSESPSKQ